jgi:hypothetical protein
MFFSLTDSSKIHLFNSDKKVGTNHQAILLSILALVSHMLTNGEVKTVNAVVNQVNHA